MVTFYFAAPMYYLFVFVLNFETDLHSLWESKNQSQMIVNRLEKSSVSGSSAFILVKVNVCQQDKQ